MVAAMRHGRGRFRVLGSPEPGASPSKTDRCQGPMDQCQGQRLRMSDPEQDPTQAALQAMLRAEILALREQIAQRDAEIAALLNRSDIAAWETRRLRALPGRLFDRLRRLALRLRHRIALRHQLAALSESPLFDAEWYARRYPDCGRPERAAEHYLLKGAFAGNDPGPGFDTRAYYRANPDVAAAGWPALAHFHLHGQAEGRRLRPVAGG